MAVSNITNSINSKLRMTGMSSGLDTDALIKSMMASDKAKLDKAKQKQDLSLWKRDAYREISTAVKAFQDEFFDVLKPTSNFKSATAFAVFNTTYSTTNDSNVATITPLAGSTPGSHSITVTSLATQAQVVSKNEVAKDIASSSHMHDGAVNFSGHTFNVTVDGTTKTITLKDYSSGAYSGLVSDVKTDVQASLNAAFGAGRITFNAADGAASTFTLNQPGSTLTVAESSNGLTDLGYMLADNKSNRVSLSANLSSIQSSFRNGFNITDPTANVSFKINDTTINLGKSYQTATITDVIDAVKASGAGVELKHSSTSGKFSLVSSTYGAVGSITKVDTEAGGLLQALGVAGTEGVHMTTTQGTDAVFNLDGVNGIRRSSNEFTIDLSLIHI